MDDMALGENLRRLRINKGMTQGDLALETGIKLGQISKTERNEADTKISTIYKLLKALDCSADSLFLDQEKTNMKGILKEAFESAAKLPEEDQISLIKIVDKFCIANGLDTMLQEHRLLINISKKGRSKSESLLPKENLEQ